MKTLKKHHLNYIFLYVNLSLGIDEEKIEIAKKMLEDNVDVELIAKYSGLTITVINKLKDII